MKKLYLFVFVILASLSLPSTAKLPSSVSGTPLPSLAPMLKRTNPAVVNIATSATIETPLMRDPVFGLLIPGERRKRSNSLGSGVIIDSSRGLIVTNHHVIQGADEIQVSLEDGREFIATLIGSDEKTDVALLQIEADQLSQTPLGNSEQLQVGDFVVAIGNPFGLGNSVTSGIVSAKGRSGLGIEQYEDFIQTDAAINPGNSGGALVDLNGNLIGINTAIFGPQGNIGIGFAIPIDLVKTITQQLLEFGEVRRGLLGISVQELSPGLARAFGISVNYGVVITEVVANSAAADAGLRATDIVLSINNKKLRTPSDLLNQEGLLPAGSELSIDVLRDNKREQFTVILNESAVIEIPGEQIHPLLSGVVLTSKKGVPSEQNALEIASVARRSVAARYGIRPKDIIEGIGRFRVRTIKQVEQIGLNPRRALPLTIKRGQQQFLVVLR